MGSLGETKPVGAHLLPNRVVCAAAQLPQVGQCSAGAFSSLSVRSGRMEHLNFLERELI